MRFHSVDRLSNLPFVCGLVLSELFKNGQGAFVADVCDDSVASVRVGHHGVLHVDDDECGVRSVGQRRHRVIVTQPRA